MKKLYAPFTLASYVLYFLLTHLSFILERWSPAYVTQKGGQQNGEGVAISGHYISSAESAFRNSPHIRKEMNHTGFCCCFEWSFLV